MEIDISPLAPVPALRQRVLGSLESLIIRQQLKPGTRLVEGDLAQLLGVSRGPIREALQSLARDGFVELRQRQGAFVRVPTMSEIDDFFDVRRVLEAEAARLAAIRATKEAVMLLNDRLAQADKALASNLDPTTNVESVHKLIAAVANNELLSQFLELINKRATWYMSPFEPTERRKSWNEHKRVIDAIARGKADEAASRMAEHIDHGRKRYKKVHSAREAEE